MAASFCPGRSAPAAETPALVDTCFVPQESCTPRIVAAIAAAKATILVQAYGFTSPPILEALAEARRRGLDVKVIVDRTAIEHRYSGATFVDHAAIPVWVDNTPAIAHTKAIIIDRLIVLGGSFNYTKSADQRNVEDVTFIRSPEVAARFTAAWEARREVSTPYGASAAAGEAPGADTLP